MIENLEKILEQQCRIISYKPFVYAGPANFVY